MSKLTRLAASCCLPARSSFPLAGCARQQGQAATPPMSPATSTRSTRWPSGAWTSGDYEHAAKLFDEVERQHPYSVWARRAQLMSAFSYYHGAEISRGDQLGAALPDHPPGQQGRALRQLSDRDELLPADRGRHPRPDDHPAGVRCVRRADPPLSGEPLCRRRAAEARPHQRPSRRQGDGGRPLLPAVGQLAGRDHPVPRRWSTNTRPPATRPRRWSGWSNAISRSAFPRRRSKAAAVLGANYPGSEWYHRSLQADPAARAAGPLPQS